jgi:hypothetical protein
VTSFVPFSPILGGAVSGYLHGSDGSGGAKVGAYAGLVAAIPFTILGLSLLGGLLVAAVELGLGSLGLFVAVAMIFSILVSMTYLVGLSALGGYFGVKIAARERSSTA